MTNGASRPTRLSGRLSPRPWLSGRWRFGIRVAKRPRTKTVDIHRCGALRGKNGRVMANKVAAQEWTPLHQLVALSSAPTVEEFYRRLVLLPPAGNNRADAFQPFCLFRQFHESEPEEAATTALLLVTDPRWRDATGRLVRSITESGWIRQPELDLLAETFLAAGPHLDWRAPSEWFDGGLEIVLDPECAPMIALAKRVKDETRDGRPVVVQRHIRPPLRRWAAERVTRADSSRWSAILRKGRELDARSAAAVARGLLDAIDTLPSAAQRLLLAICGEWPQRDVRRAVKDIVCRPSRPTRVKKGPWPTDPTPEASPKRPEIQPALF